jgi:hypothetical protein
MSTPEVPASKRLLRTRISRRMAFILGVFVVSVVHPFIFGVLPWLLSLLTPRFGWTEHGPAAWNVLGLFPVVAGPLSFSFRRLHGHRQDDRHERRAQARPDQ